MPERSHATRSCEDNRDHRAISRRSSVLAVMIAIALAWTVAARAQPDEPVDFSRHIRPLLARKCFKCHGPAADESGLRLHSAESAAAPAASGQRAIVPGDSAASELLRRVCSTDDAERMPPEGAPLSAREIDLLRRWIDGGARYDQHWSFRSIVAPQLPSVRRSEWLGSPLDAFILASLERAKLAPAAPAERAALIRRVTLDLTGLPPSPEEVDAFLADPSPDAYERLVDRLLASPHYGERWARHWLDLVRYADTNSFERDGVKGNAWRYRDYVIRSFNDDKPYDQFIREQLAGDELPSVTPDSLIATAYYRLGLWDDEPADPLQAKFDEYDDIVSTTAQVMLGLTLNCGRCHDHKIDPLAQTDYYRLLAFFADVPGYGNRADQKSFNQLDLTHGDVLNRYGPEYARLAATLEPGTTTLAICRTTSQPETIRVLSRGNPHAPAATVEPGFPEIFGFPDPAIPPAESSAPTAGRRRVLADWIVSPKNPLAARVIVNRLWQHHFGRGLVRSTNNFGLGGDSPTHPELLDYLATELIQGGWRLKPLQRAIVLSATYRSSSRASAAVAEVDPQNLLLSHFPLRRLSAEEVRDAIHVTAGTFNPTMYGPGMFPRLSAEVLAGQSLPGSGWGNSPEYEQARRSVYIHVKRSLVMPLLSSFDFPETDSSCEARFVTTLPTQALALVNGEFSHAQAALFAADVATRAGDDSRARVRLVLRRALTRPVTDEEVSRGEMWLARFQQQSPGDAQAALRLYCLMVLNLNEFVYVD